MIPRTSALTLPSGTVRRVPKASQNRKVPLWTVEPDGQLFTGFIRVPLEMLDRVNLEYVTPAQHTNKRLRFEKYIEEHLLRWAAWRAQRGWYITDEPRVTGPSDPPHEDKSKAKRHMARAQEKLGRVGSVEPITDHDNELNYKWYITEARFSREFPIYAPLDDLLFLRHLAFQYGVDPDRDPLPYNELPEGKDVIDVEGGLDPMKVAEERREALGIKREDYLFGDLREPL